MNIGVDGGKYIKNAIWVYKRHIVGENGGMCTKVGKGGEGWGP